MKLTFKIIILFSSILFSQNKGGYFEIYTHTVGNSNSGLIQFWMNNVGTVWDQDHSKTQTYQNITNSFNLARACYIYDENTTNVPVPYSGYNYGIYSALTSTTTPDRNYGYGLYKFCIGYEYNNPVLYFYLDWRDCDYSDYYTFNDTWVQFNTTNNTAKIDWNNSNFTDKVTNVQNGAIYSIWIEKEKEIGHGEQNTAFFNNFWQNCLVLIKSDNNHPRLVWGTYPNGNAIGYYLYRKITENSGMITLQKFKFHLQQHHILIMNLKLDFP